MKYIRIKNNSINEDFAEDYFNDTSNKEFDEMIYSNSIDVAIDDADELIKEAYRKISDYTLQFKDAKPIDNHNIYHFVCDTIRKDFETNTLRIRMYLFNRIKEAKDQIDYIRKRVELYGFKGYAGNSDSDCNFRYVLYTSTDRGYDECTCANTNSLAFFSAVPADEEINFNNLLKFSSLLCSQDNDIINVVDKVKDIYKEDSDYIKTIANNASAIEDSDNKMTFKDLVQYLRYYFSSFIIACANNYYREYRYGHHLKDNDQLMINIMGNVYTLLSFILPVIDYLTKIIPAY